MRSLFRSRDPEPAVIVEPVPTVFPAIAGADIAAVFAGKRVAGDFYDSIRVSPQRVLIGLLDVAGRRDDSRHLLTMAQDIFRKAGAELFSVADVNESDAMTELNHLLNRGLIDTCCGVRSCPAFIACYHQVFGTLCYTNAGHPPGLLRDSTGITELDSTGLPLGLFSHATADARIVGLEKGAGLLLVSRGLMACEGRSAGEEFGLNRIKDFFQHDTGLGARALCESILNSVNDFGGKVPLCDDRTALALLRAA
jgi:phosphoserine phosphatase RsbU/P